MIVSHQQACLQDQLKFIKLLASGQRVPGLILGVLKVVNMQGPRQFQPLITVHFQEVEVMVPIERGAVNMVLHNNSNSEREGPAAVTDPGEDIHPL